MIGRTLSHYRIEAPLGEGGMGVVYRARDFHLERDVALKVLPEGALADEAARKRFRREALALSQLNHPHIATVFDFDTQEGVDFLVMELVAGEPLNVRLKAGALPETEVMGLGAQIAEALEAAHEQGIVHRDLKPANVVLTAKGQVKVLDFGLARLLRPREGMDLSRSLTEAEVAVGTVPYMAPEQLLGHNVDARADLYALGVVLYELVAGRSPYKETVPTALVYEIVNQAVPSPRAVAPQVSERFETIILRCLAKEPEQRYGSARELAADLKDASRPVAAPTRRRRSATRARWQRALGVGALGVAALVATVMLLNPGGWRDRVLGTTGPGAIRAIAVLPLENLSNDPEQAYFADGMTDELITRLAQVAALRVISRTSVMQFKGTKKRLPQIARELRVDAVVEGSVLRSGERARISAQLIRAATDENVWADSYEGDMKDVLSLQSQVARAIVERVRVSLTPSEREGLAKARQVDPAVSEAYLRGRYHSARFTREDGEKAIKYFNQAIDLDPTYARAYAGLANAYCVYSGAYLESREAMPKAKAAALKALEIDDAVAEAHIALAYVTAFHDWAWSAAEAEFRQALELLPGDATAHQWFGYYLMLNRRFDEASRELRRAWEIDPLSPLISTMQLWPLFEGRQYDRAIQVARKLIASDPTQQNVRLVLGQAYLMKGDYAAGLAALREVSRAEGGHVWAMAWLGYGYARAGKRDSATTILSELLHLSKLTYVSAYTIALLYAGLNDKDQAFAWLERCLDEHLEDAAYLQVDPGMDPLRADPRFAEALRRVGFAPPAGATR